LLEDRKTFLAVPPGDIPGMATAVETLMADKALRQTLSSNIRALAKNIWSDQNMHAELEKIYG
jgi:glycosyltransferase involved in cell wall biosynthesis